MTLTQELGIEYLTFPESYLNKVFFEQYFDNSIFSPMYIVALYGGLLCPTLVSVRLWILMCQT